MVEVSQNGCFIMENPSMDSQETSIILVLKSGGLQDSDHPECPKTFGSLMEVVKLNGDFQTFILDDCQCLTVMILSTTRDALHLPTIWVYLKMCYPPN